MNTRKKFVSVKEAAGFLGISPITVYRLLWAGKITKGVSRTPTGRYLIDLDEVLEELRHWAALLAERKRRQSAEK